MIMLQFLTVIVQKDDYYIKLFRDLLGVPEMIFILFCVWFVRHEPWQWRRGDGEIVVGENTKPRHRIVH